MENWKLRRALARPYFLRSTTRLSRVRKPAALTVERSTGGYLAIHAVAVQDYRMWWSWPLFLAATGLAWGLMAMQR